MAHWVYLSQLSIAKLQLNLVPQRLKHNHVSWCRQSEDPGSQGGGEGRGGEETGGERESRKKRELGVDRVEQEILGGGCGPRCLWFPEWNKD